MALELTLLLADRQDEKYDRAAMRWHARFVYETTNVDLRESVAVLALLTAIPANRLAAAALAEAAYPTAGTSSASTAASSRNKRFDESPSAAEGKLRRLPEDPG